MTATTLGHDIDTALDAIADGFAASQRSPVLHTPAEHGLAHEEVTFPSADGVPLEGWLVPAPDPRGLVIANHPRWFSRSGLPSHLEPWRSIGAETGNDVEVDFTPDIRILHDAGYSVLAYDMRNSGLSGAANGGLTSGGVHESRDVVGSLAFARGRPDLRGLPIGLFSRCMGANATFFAMDRHPAAFDGVRCLVACQPLSVRVVLEQGMRRAGLPLARLDDLEERIRLRTSFGLDAMSPVVPARRAVVPTLLYQVRDDPTTRPDDVAAVHDALPGEKDLFWIDGTTRRWDGYLHFQRSPGRVLDWLRRYGS